MLTAPFLRSADLQMINITLRVLYKPEISRLPQIFRNLGTDYDERVLPSIVNETLKSVVVSVVCCSSRGMCVVCLPPSP